MTYRELRTPTLPEIIEAVADLCEQSRTETDSRYHDTPDDYRVTDYDGRELVAAEITPTTVRLRFGRPRR